MFEKLFPKKLLSARLNDADGFVDLDLPITEIATAPNGDVRFTARGELSGKELGFAFVLHSAWNPQPLEDHSASFYWGHGEFQSIGPASDNFLNVLLELYSLSVTNGSIAMVESIPVEVVGLDSDPSKAKMSGARMKTFFHCDAEDQERYAEVFININIEEGMLEFHEKDNGYRVPLTLALCGG